MAEVITERTDEQQDELIFPATLPVLPLKDTVVFPGFPTPLAIGQKRSIKVVEDVVSGDRVLALVTVKNEEADQPGWDDLYRIGTAAVVHKMIKVPDGTLRILVEGVRRIGLDRAVQEDPYLVGEFVEMPDDLEETREVEALTRNVQSLFGRVISLVPYLPEELQIAAANVEDPSALCNLVASTLRLKTEEKQTLLELLDVESRLREISTILSRELEVFELGSKIQSQVQEEMEKGQREFFLRQQLKAIQDELGEGDAEQAEINELRGRFAELELPEDAQKSVDRELSRLERLPSAAAEYGVIRTYLDWIATLPWAKTTEDNLDLARAREVLDEDHYDLEKVKDRIIEHLAVSKLRNDPAGPILCFVGPPGVGKTSLGQSIARALERKFARLSVGGVRDEAEIRGHRRTYIGAMPGTIIRTLRDAESMNPVLLIDEIDKMGADFRGDPASAMLEVLDPEQNKHFRDHYLDLPFDLSKVLFICTANPLRIDERRVRSSLGPRRFEGEVRKRTSDPGVATGLAFTAVGGDVLFFEATAYPGKGRLTITGQLGDVMQESAQAALSWVRAHAQQLGLDPDWFRDHDVHLHVPAGAVPKDGPSAGITMATAIASLVRQQPVSDDVGMTGEITLTGQVLPIGGIREKSLAAQRAGLKRVIMPRENEPDLAELPAETKRELEFVLVDSIDEVFEAAFNGAASGRTKPVPVQEKHAARPAEPVARAGFEPSSGVGRA